MRSYPDPVLTSRFKIHIKLNLQYLLTKVIIQLKIYILYTSPLKLNGRRNFFFSLPKVFFSLMARPLPPPPPLNSLAISGATFFAASQR